MVIKIIRKIKSKKSATYKSSKMILTTADIKNADEFDQQLNKTIKKIENILLEDNILSRQYKKKDPLRVWYIMGECINNFLEKHYLSKEDEHLFWDNLYGRSSIIHGGNPISKTRNDFKTASLLAKYPLGILKKVGSWALWREVLGYRIFLNDKRIFDWLINELIKHPKTRNDARPLLKAVAFRLRRIDTSVLDNNELLKILESVN